MRKFFLNSWFFIGLILVIFIGIHFPSVGLTIKPWISDCVFLSMLLIGFHLDLAEIARAVKNIKAICIAMLMGFVAQPMLAFFLGNLFFSSDFELFAGVILCAAVPTTQASSVIWTDMTKGNRSLAVVLMSIANFSGVFLAPTILWLLLGADVHLSPFDMIMTLVKFVLLPIVLGQVAKALVPATASRIYPASKIVNILFIWMTVLSALSGQELSSLPLLSVLVCVAIQYTMIAALSFYGSRLVGLNEEESIAVMFCSAQATLTFAALIGFTYFAGISILYVVVYHLFQQFMGQATALLFTQTRRRKERLRPPPALS